MALSPGSVLALATAVPPHRLEQSAVADAAFMPLEIAVVPLALGLPRFAVAFFIIKAALLAWRIWVENQALAWAARAETGPQGLPAATLANGGLRR